MRVGVRLRARVRLSPWAPTGQGEGRCEGQGEALALGASAFFSSLGGAAAFSFLGAASFFSLGAW